MHCRCNFPLTCLSDMFIPDAFFQDELHLLTCFIKSQFIFAPVRGKILFMGQNHIWRWRRMWKAEMWKILSRHLDAAGNEWIHLSDVQLQCFHSQLNQLITLKLCGLRLTVCWCVLVWCFLRSQLHDVPVAAVQRALCRCPVLGFELWSDRVDDEPRRQVEAFGQLRLTRSTSCTQTHKIKSKSNTGREKHRAESSRFVWCGFPNSTFLRINAKLHGSDIQIFTFNTWTLDATSERVGGGAFFWPLTIIYSLFSLFFVVVVIQAFIIDWNKKSGNLCNAFPDQRPD